LVCEETTNPAKRRSKTRPGAWCHSLHLAGVASSVPRSKGPTRGDRAVKKGRVPKHPSVTSSLHPARQMRMIPPRSSSKIKEKASSYRIRRGVSLIAPVPVGLPPVQGTIAMRLCRRAPGSNSPFRQCAPLSSPPGSPGSIQSGGIAMHAASHGRFLRLFAAQCRTQDYEARRKGKEANHCCHCTCALPLLSAVVRLCATLLHLTLEKNHTLFFNST
jgi:hypothetical protein